jgi:8-oxo-dGTP pyrophosphatase MutT (NUDIX family)
MELTSHKNKFLDLVIEKLGNTPIDFFEKLKCIKALRKSQETHLAAGILLILNFKKNLDLSGPDNGEFFIQLIKRSDKVSQPGDLSCPGGMLDRFYDPILSFFISTGLIPTLQGSALTYASKRGHDTFKTINLFLANALRESWEEIGISPFNILFLGALPSYSFYPAKRTIFPIAGVVKNSYRLHLNEEVEKIVDIPLKEFFNTENFARFIIEPPLPSRPSQDYPQEYPCLVYTDSDGDVEILWGATYNIIMDFLHLTLGYNQPDLKGRRIISRSLRPDYMRYLKK